MRRSLALPLLLFVVPLAGCSEPASEPEEPPIVADPAAVWPLLSKNLTGAEVVKEQHWIPMADGKKLDTWVYRPKGEAPLPVILNFSPYWSNLAPPAAEGGDAFSRYLIDYFVPKGYAVALNSLRGTGLSEGCFNLGGDVEKRDAASVIEYVSRQSWSNGNVAAGGKSYDGTVPQGVATLNPPALKAIIPVSAISELYKYNSMGGLSYGATQGDIFNTYYPALVGWGVYPFNAARVPPDPDESKVLFPDQLSPDDPCADYVQQNREGFASAAAGDYTAYWQERDYAKDARNATAALFFIHGFQDWNVKPDHMLPWLANYGGPKRAWLHQWAQPTQIGGEGGHVYPFRGDFNYTLLRFLDQTLKGVDTQFFDEPSFQVHDTKKRWRYETQWPAANRTERLYLADARLQAAAGDGAVRAFVDDGSSPDPASEGFGPEGLRNQLLYASDALQEDWHLTGVPDLRLRVSTQDPGAKVAATLYDVAPGGKATIIDWGGLLLRARDDPRHPRDVSPTEAHYDVRVPLFPQDTVVAKGHKLVLALAGNAGADEFFPRAGSGDPFGVMSAAQSYLEFARLDAEPRFEPEMSQSKGCWLC